MAELLAKLRRALDRRRGLDEDLNEEMRSHLELLAEDKVAQGMPPEEARAAARRHFGNPAAVQERAREAWQFPRVETFLQDLRYSLRSMRKSPGFSLVVILTLALGIGVNTAVFSVVYSVLLRPLPYPSGERLVWLGESSGQATGISVTWINFQHWRNENRVFEDMAGFARTDMTLTGRGEALLTHAATVTSSFFKLTGARPIQGRLPGDADDQPGAAPMVLLSYDFWAKALGADPSVVGSDLTLNGSAYQVVGVLRPGRNFLGRVDYYLPLGRAAGRTIERSAHGSMRVLGLLKPGVTLAQARTGLDDIMKRLAVADPGPEDDHRVYAEYLSEETTGGVRQTLLMLMGAVGLVLLLACANVASLLLVRNTARAREIAIRTAIGAGRARLARQLLTENLAIAAAGGGSGLALAALCLRTLVSLAPGSIPRLSEAALDLPALAFAAAMTVLVGLLAGLAPVLGAGRVDLTLALKEGAAGSGSRRQAVRNGLVVAEIAVTLVLSFGSGLLLRSLIAAQTANPGFDSHHLLALELQLPSSRYQTGDRQREYYDRLAAGLRAQPGVKDVGAVNCPPSAGDCGDYWYSVLDRPSPARSDVPVSLFNLADAAYFRGMRIPLLAGRTFADADRAGTPLVVVVNEEFARKWWTAPQLAVGRQIKVGGPYMEGPTCQIVGVVGNVSQWGLDRSPEEEIYYAFSQRPSEAMVVMIRAAGEPERLIPSVRRQVASIDRNVPIQSVRPFEQWLAAPLERRRFTTLLLGIFAALAIVLASIGIYGVLNYWVGVRHKEIAIRMAVGAPRSAILRWAGAHAARLAGLGVALGALGAWSASTWLENLVFGVSAKNPGMLIAAGAAVVGIAALAAGLPLRRAMRVDVVRNLHDA